MREGKRPPTYRAVVLTALPVEYRAVRAHLSDLREEVHPEGTVYERGRFTSEQGIWEVLIAESGAGNARAAVETARALPYFKPHVALFVGVAGGLKDVSQGDVVFATKVYFYESAKVQAGLKPRPDVGECSYALEQRARAVARKEDWLQRIIGPAPAKPQRALLGPLASGEKVLAEARSELCEFLRTNYEDALAVEMEGRGFLMAARAHQGVEALVIRSISDRLDDKQQADASGAQELASRHASACAFELLSRFVPLSGELALQRPRPEEQGALWSVPYPRNPHFTGRDALLQDIRAHFLASSSPIPLALHGLGGVGKTQLALEYASRYASDEHHYSHVLWLRADEPSVLASSYAGLAEVLELPETAEKEQAQKIEAVRRWLQQNDGWLLVFDNAQPGSLSPYLPPTFKGHVLITSLDHTWGQLAKPYPVEVLAPAACVEFLRKRTGQEDVSAATLLALALGGLPLALAQAAAYVEQTGKALADYLRLFEQRQKDLLERPGPPTDYPHSVATTWALSFEQVQARMPEAAALLSLCSFLAPSPIPTVLLVAGSELLPEPLSAAVTDEVRWDELLGTLRRYSLVQVHSDHLLFHPLVQAVMRGRLAEDASRWTETALGLIDRFFVFDALDTRTWLRCAVLLPHALETTRHAGELGTGLELLPGLLFHLGCFWEEQAEYGLARHALSWGLEALQRASSASPQQEADLLHRLGVVALDSGALGEAQQHFERAQALIQAFPPGTARQEGTANLLCDLAALESRRGRFHEARAHAEKALTLLEAAVAGDHLLLGHAASILGSILVQQADFAQARIQLERALLISQKHFGDDHPKTAVDLHNLGSVLERLGKYVEARHHYDQALHITEERYGPAHPELATGLDNLGRILQEQGEGTQARASFERALSIHERIYGIDHPRVANVLNNLGVLLMEMKEFTQARVHLERAVAIDEKAYGPDHPEVATDLANLASVLIRQGAKEQGRERLQQALAIYDRNTALPVVEAFSCLVVLGKVHYELREWASARSYLERALELLEQSPEDEPQRFELLLMIGSSLRHLKEYAQAVTWLERARALPGEGRDPRQLCDLLLLLGTCYRELDQPEQSRTNLEAARQLAEDTHDPILLSHVRFEQGRLARHQQDLQTARQLIEQVWEQRSEAELERPDTVLVELGIVLEALDDLEGARVRFEEALRFAESLRGPDSISVANCSAHLGRILCRQGHLTEARPHLERALALREPVEGPSSVRVARTLQYLAEVKFYSLQLSEAEADVRRALSIYSAAQAPPDEGLTEALIILGGIHQKAGALKEAQAHYEQALSLLEALPGRKESQLIFPLSMLGSVQALQRAYPQARATWERALKIACADAAPKPLLQIDLNRKLGDLCKETGDLKEARFFFTRTVELHEALPAPDHLSLAKDRLKLANLLRILQEDALALPLTEQGVKVLEAASPDMRELSQALMLRGDIHLHLENWERARASYEQALKKTPDNLLPPNLMSMLHHNLGMALMKLGSHKRALLHMERALPFSAKAHGTEHPDYAMVLANIGVLFSQTGKRTEAVKKLKRALAIFEQHKGPHHPITRQIREELAGLSR